MELARVCAGFTAGQSDRLRQAMTHKRSDEAMARLREEVYGGMASKGIFGKPADEIWDKLQGFASFGFPESHSVSFAYIVYASAWLKYHWPAEFFTGLLNAQPMGFYTPNSLVQDAQHHGVTVLSPDVNVSWFDCTVEPHDAPVDDLVDYLGMQWRRGRGALSDPIRPAVALRIGLRYVRNLGEADITRIEAARMVGGPFSSPEDLAQRTGLAVDAFEALAASGALTVFGIERREGIWAAGALGGVGPDRLALAGGTKAPNLPEMSSVETMQGRPVVDRHCDHPSCLVPSSRVVGAGVSHYGRVAAYAQTWVQGQGRRGDHPPTAAGNGQRSAFSQSRRRNRSAQCRCHASSLGGQLRNRSESDRGHHFRGPRVP